MIRKYNRRISVGDLNGIGSEIILKTFEDSRMLELCTPVILLMSSCCLVKRI
jgi:4-hydroxy-L-threonine phosphate dehydrogenase PdxA